LGIRTVTDAHPSELLSVSVTSPGFIENLGGREAKRAYRGLGIRHTKEEIVVELIAVLAMVGSI
jgi:hypothetical protein